MPACPVSLDGAVIAPSALAFCCQQVGTKDIKQCVALRRAKEEAERKERHERQMKAEASRAKKKADEIKKKVSILGCAVPLHVVMVVCTVHVE